MSVVATTLTGADQTIYEPPAGTDGVGTLFGWSFSAAAACTVNFRADSLSGQILAVAVLGAAGASTEWFGPQGIQAKGGLYVDVVAGTPVGSIFHA